MKTAIFDAIYHRGSNLVFVFFWVISRSLAITIKQKITLCFNGMSNYDKISRNTFLGFLTGKNYNFLLKLSVYIQYHSPV